MLSDFFRLNLPYGMQRDANSHKWVAFNREYKPLGATGEEEPPENNGLRAYRLYPALTDSFIMELTGYDINMVERDQKGNICKFRLYDDRTNPMNRKEHENSFWNTYWGKLQKLSQLSIFGV